MGYFSLEDLELVRSNNDSSDWKSVKDRVSDYISNIARRKVAIFFFNKLEL